MREPERELKVRIPVDMDDGTTKPLPVSEFNIQVQGDPQKVVLDLQKKRLSIWFED